MAFMIDEKKLTEFKKEHASDGKLNRNVTIIRKRILNSGLCSLDEIELMQPMLDVYSTVIDENVDADDMDNDFKALNSLYKILTSGWEIDSDSWKYAITTSSVIGMIRTGLFRDQYRLEQLDTILNKACRNPHVIPNMLNTSMETVNRNGIILILDTFTNRKLEALSHEWIHPLEIRNAVATDDDMLKSVLSCDEYTHELLNHLQNAFYDSDELTNKEIQEAFHTMGNLVPRSTVSDRFGNVVTILFEYMMLLSSDSRKTFFEIMQGFTLQETKAAPSFSGLSKDELEMSLDILGCRMLNKDGKRRFGITPEAQRLLSLLGPDGFIRFFSLSVEIDMIKYYVIDDELNPVDYMPGIFDTVITDTKDSSVINVRLQWLLDAIGYIDDSPLADTSMKTIVRRTVKYLIAMMLSAGDGDGDALLESMRLPFDVWTTGYMNSLQTN